MSHKAWPIAWPKPRPRRKAGDRVTYNPTRPGAMQELIRSGAAWHPDIDADGHIGRQANVLIARGVCKSPCARDAMHMRHLFDVAEPFGLHHGRRS